jgi:hypothetical protein
MELSALFMPHKPPICLRFARFSRLDPIGLSGFAATLMKMVAKTVVEAKMLP